MRSIVFFGTSAFAADILQYMITQNIPVSSIVTRPDRPQGRDLHLCPPPVKEMAQKLVPHIPIFQPEKASVPEFASQLATFQPDLFVVVAFGEIIKQNLLDLPRLGAINIHASLLPRYRGAAPIQRCLMDGAGETGVTIIDMVLQMDAGDILEMAKIPVPKTMTFGELEEQLMQLGCVALKKVIDDFATGEIKRIPQDHTLATFAPKITAEETILHWNRPAGDLHNLIRALSPFPGASSFVLIGGQRKRLKVKRSAVVEDLSGAPGSTLIFNKTEWVVATGGGALRLLEVQLEGKKTMPISNFLQGQSAAPIVLSA